MPDSKGVVKNIDILQSEVLEDLSHDSCAVEDCASDDQDSISDTVAHKMFSNRSIKEISLGNLQQFKLLNRES